jgi:uncharacterized membrane protein HdeD (DUF308 family)
MTVETLARNWGLIVWRGIAGVLFGLAAFVWPGLTFVALVYLFGAYALVDGGFAAITGLTRIGSSTRWWVFLLEGLVGIAVGLVTFLWPGITALALIYMIAAWAIVTGAFEIAAAVRLRREIDNEWLLALSGVLSILLGVLLAFQPGAGQLVVTWTLGAYALVFGVLLIILGVRLRNWRLPSKRNTTSGTYQNPIRNSRS